TFQSSELQQQLAQMRVLVSVLRSLDRIRTIAAGGMWATTSTSPLASFDAVSDRLSVKGDLQRAILLEQALQVVDWFARQRLLGPGSNPGRFGAHMEWRRLVSRRTAKAAHRRIFLEELLQSLELRSSYPELSKAQMLKSVLLKSRGVDSTTWTTKLALLVYYLMDAALLDSGPGQGGPWGPRFQDAMEDMRRTFRLSAADLGVWQCCFLLDCASPASSEAEDPFLARACALLPSYVTEDTPFSFIEVLLALDRPDVALSLDRGQESGPGATTAPASTSGRCGRPLEQTLTLMDVRLRCGLMTDALMLLRHHTADLVARGKTETEVRRQTRVLLRHLAEWAKEADKGAGTAEAAGPVATGGGGWLNRLTELPLNATEEFVLLEWLVEQMRTPIGAFAPLFFLQRGRIAEGVSAWSKHAMASDSEGSTPLLPLLQSSVDSEVEVALPLPLRSVSVPLPPAAVAANEPNSQTLLDLAPGQGAVSILVGLVLYDVLDQAAVLPFHGTEPPPLITRVVQLPASSPSAGELSPVPVDTTSSTATAAARGSSGSSGGEQLTQALTQALAQAQPAQRQQQASSTAGPLLMPNKAPFHVRPETSSLDAGRPLAPSQPVTGGGGGGGGTGLLFSIGARTAAAGISLQSLLLSPSVAAEAGGGDSTRTRKRAKISDWA
ncbi:hypothetical protein VaNZ11_011745, partial [Volvox africanus]